MLAGADRLPTIPTARLRLRALTAGDVPALFDIFSDPAVCRYWSRPALPDLAAASALQEEIAELFSARALFQWGIVEVHEDVVVGTCTLAGISREHLRAEAGFALAQVAWGRGYIAEALPAIVSFAFETLGLHRLEADVDPRNAASIRALERVGFEREGFQRDRYYLQEEWQDAILYGLLQRDWAAKCR